MVRLSDVAEWVLNDCALTKEFKKKKKKKRTRKATSVSIQDDEIDGPEQLEGMYTLIIVIACTSSGAAKKIIVVHNLLKNCYTRIIS